MMALVPLLYTIQRLRAFKRLPPRLCSPGHQQHPLCSPGHPPQRTPAPPERVQAPSNACHRASAPQVTRPPTPRRPELSSVKRLLREVFADLLAVRARLDALEAVKQRKQRILNTWVVTMLFTP
jgi:hypothetical protein